MTRIVQAYFILDEQDRPVSVFYPKDGIKPFPMKQTPVQTLQTPKTMPRIEQIHHPTTREQRDRAYKHHI